MSRVSLLNNLSIIDIKSVNADFNINLSGYVRAGFPSPANDYLENELNFKELLVRNESSTFFVQVMGNSMIGSNIHDGDILIVDKSLSPRDDSILVCYLDGEFTVKRVQSIGGSLYLVADNPDFSPIKVSDCADFRFWGVVTFSIHKHR
jgi:DNA polymerase V